MTKSDNSAAAESLTPAPSDPLTAWMRAIAPGAAPEADPADERNAFNVRAQKSWADVFIHGRTNGTPTT